MIQTTTMSTTIPIQDLDPTNSPPSDRAIRAVVTLSWPYSSSTRQCALLLSEPDFRLRARGGQIRVKFSGPAARAVAGSRLGIGDEVLLELGAGEWAAGAAVHVPGKSVGELHFERGVRLRVQKEGSDDVEVSVADDEANEVEEETPQPDIAPTKVTSPITNFRSSIGVPGSAAIYSSPAYMRKAAKFSYLDGISRLFEDEWDNQDLPRKKARISMGEVKSWKVVGRTPSPERSSPTATLLVEEDMVDVSQVEQTIVESTIVEDLPAMAFVAGQGTAAETRSARSSPTPAPLQHDVRPASSANVADPQSSPPQLLETGAREEQSPLETQADVDAFALPKPQSPRASSTHLADEAEGLKEQAVDPVTPKLVPQSSTALPSTTTQISPLASRNELAAEIYDRQSKDTATTSPEDLPSGDLAEKEMTILTSPSKATESLLDQLRSTTGQSEPATEPILPEPNDVVDVNRQWDADDLAEEDTFSDDEASDALVADENDDELMLEDDAEDIFNADELEGEEPSDDDSDEDMEMPQLPAQQWLEESTTEKDSDIEEQASASDRLDSEVTTQSQASANGRSVSQQTGFAPASTLLHAAETPAKTVQPATVTEETSTTTPLKKAFFALDGAVESTEIAEVTTPATKPTDTPKRTPQSARDKVMKRTFHSLFGIKATPSPEKEDMPMGDDTAGTERDIPEQAVDRAANLDEVQIPQVYHNDINETPLAQTTTVDASDDPMAESTTIEDVGSQDQSELQTDAGPQDERPAKTELPDHTSHETQEQAVQPEPAVSVREQSPELINLDSSSDVEEMDDLLREPEDDQTTKIPSASDPVPQKRSPMFESETRSSPAAVEVTARPTHDDVGEPMALDTMLFDAGDQNIHHGTFDIEPISLVDAREELSAQPPRDLDMGSAELEVVSASLEIVTQSDQLVPDLSERPSAVLSAPESPVIEVVESIAVDMALNEETQPERLQNPTDVMSLDVDEISSEHSAHSRSSVSSYKGLDGESAPVTLETPIVVQDILEIVEPSRPSASSYQGLDGESAPVTLEPPTVVQDILEIVEPSQDDGVEMLDDEREEPESSHASFQSQVIQDSVDDQRHSLHEHSSRPTSRDTAENFSPMVLGSMAQRVTDLVSEESSMMRLQELEAQDDMEVEQVHGEDLEIFSTANTIVDDLLKQTPTRSAPSQVVEIESSPSELLTISPVRIPRATQQQEPTPQATFDVDMQEPNARDKEIDEMQDFSEIRAYPDMRDALAVERQLQAEVENEAGPPSLLSPEQTEQNNATDMVDKEYEQARITLPLSPSATQTAEHEAQLSHANISQAAMQPTPATSQLQSSAQLLVEPNLLEISDNIATISHEQSHEVEVAEPSEIITNVSQLQSHEKKATGMPPPEQAIPPKTPAKKSLRSRLSNVPDVISAWFSPKRSSIVAQEPEERTEVETPVASILNTTEKTRTSRRRASGLSTAHAYFTSLASLSQHVNPASQQAGSVDVLAIVTDFTKEPERAKGGPRDYYTIFRVTDPSMPSSADVRVEVFRPWKAVLPAADVGDVVLLRAFVVKSKQRQPYLLSTDSSAWCVWRFAEHSKATARGGAGGRDGEKPVWATRMSHSEVREEVKGPPVEYGMAEKEQARKLRDWWTETRGEAEGGASEEPVGEGRGEEEEVEVVEL
jgi:hypothetical protein